MILAIDPSSRNLGYAVFTNEEELAAYGLKVLRGDIYARTREAFRWIAELLAAYPIETVVIEGLVGKFAGAIIPQARVSGAIICALPPSVRIEEIPPSTVKKRLLKGDATKEEIAKVVASRYNFDQQNKFDISDAIAVGMAYFSGQRG